MAYLTDRLEAFRHQLMHKRQQLRLAEIKAELEIAQQDCAALGAHIGELIRTKTELETELMRKES